MLRIILFFFVIISPCRSLFELPSNSSTPDTETGNLLLETFNSPECTNPCWLGIEVGESDREFVVNALEQDNINYVANGDYTYNLYLEGNPSPLWRDMAEPLGDIHLDGETVYLMMFNLDLCVVTILMTYGTPDIIPQDSTLDLIYHDVDLLFVFDLDLQRVVHVRLYRDGYINQAFLPSEWQPWENFSHILSDDCTDALTQ